MRSIKQQPVLELTKTVKLTANNNRFMPGFLFRSDHGQGPRLAPATDPFKRSIGSCGCFEPRTASPREIVLLCLDTARVCRAA